VRAREKDSDDSRSEGFLLFQSLCLSLRLNWNTSSNQHRSQGGSTTPVIHLCGRAREEREMKDEVTTKFTQERRSIRGMAESA